MTNKDRAKQALDTLKQYCKLNPVEDEGTEIMASDFLTDLMHLLSDEKIDFNDVHDRAFKAFLGECAEEDAKEGGVQ